MDAAFRWITRYLGYFLMILMAVIVLDVTLQVVTRFILKNPSSYTEELAGFLLIWIGILGASYALYTRAHLGVDVLIHKLGGVKKKIVEIVVFSLVFIFALFVMVIGGMNLVRLTFTLNQVAPALGIRIGYVYAVLPISGVLMMMYSLHAILHAGKNKVDEFDQKNITVMD